jgi:hypothetical protein
MIRFATLGGLALRPRQFMLDRARGGMQALREALVLSLLLNMACPCTGLARLHARMGSVGGPPTPLGG